MRIARVSTPPHFSATCYGCLRRVHTWEGDALYADLDGEPFVAYYCDFCAKQRGEIEP